MPSHRSIFRVGPGVVFGVLVTIAVCRTVIHTVASQNQAAAQAWNQARQDEARAAELARQNEAARIAERARVEQGIAGQWYGVFASHVDSRLTITRSRIAIDAVLLSGGYREVLRGELLADNRLMLTPISVSRVSDFGPDDYALDTIWTEFSADGASLKGRFRDSSNDTGPVDMKRIALDAYQDQAVPIEDRARVAQAFGGEWYGTFGDHTDASLSITLDKGTAIGAVLISEGFREVLRGELLADNRLMLTPVSVTRVNATGSDNYALDTIWIELGADRASLQGNYRDANKHAGPVSMLRVHSDLQRDSVRTVSLTEAVAGTDTQCSLDAPESGSEDCKGRADDGTHTTALPQRPGVDRQRGGSALQALIAVTHAIAIPADGYDVTIMHQAVYERFSTPTGDLITLAPAMNE